MNAQLFCQTQCVLGEGPFWHMGRVYWFDILQQQLHSCNANGNEHQTDTLPEMFSAGASLSANELLLASETALWRYQLKSKALEKLHDLEANKAHTRSNDGRADYHGGFWIGTMGKQAQAGAGAIYRYYQGDVIELLDNITISNSICFAPNGRLAYFTDTPKGIIYRWALDSEGWPKGEPQVWLDLASQNIHPDGSVVDSAGFLWNAQWGASQVVRYSPDGDIDQVVKLPASQVTCPAFIGAKLDQLVITTAREGMNKTQLAQEPLAGSVFSVSLDTAGLPSPKVSLG